MLNSMHTGINHCKNKLLDISFLAQRVLAYVVAVRSADEFVAGQVQRVQLQAEVARVAEPVGLTLEHRDLRVHSLQGARRDRVVVPRQDPGPVRQQGRSPVSSAIVTLNAIANTATNGARRQKTSSFSIGRLNMA